MTVYFDKRRVRKNGQEIPLTLTEFLLLEILLRNPDTVLSREKLLEVVWGFGTAGDTRTVDVHIMKLRRKLAIRKRPSSKTSSIRCIFPFAATLKS